MQQFDFDNGQSEYDSDGNTIYLNKDETPFLIFHEIGHVIVGESEDYNRDEILAHGVALGISFALGIEIPKEHQKILESCVRGDGSVKPFIKEVTEMPKDSKSNQSSHERKYGGK